MIELTVIERMFVMFLSIMFMGAGLGTVILGAALLLRLMQVIK